MSEFIAPVCEEQIDIIYQDADILLINKPSGLLSLSGKNPLNKDSVHHRLVRDFPAARLLHRLDFGTSGVMLVALNKTVNGELTKQFQAGKIEKRYIAMLIGHVKQNESVVDGPIAKGAFPLMVICHKTGKPAVSQYQVLERLESPKRTRVEYAPITGRTHQLRLHSQYMGHPIIGCDLYRNEISESLASRLCLHATSIAFTHPMTGERMRIESPCPF